MIQLVTMPQIYHELLDINCMFQRFDNAHLLRYNDANRTHSCGGIGNDDGVISFFFRVEIPVMIDRYASGEITIQKKYIIASLSTIIPNP